MRMRAIGQLLAPGYGVCERCRTPWKFVEGKTIHYDVTGQIISPPFEQLQRLQEGIGWPVEWQPVGPNIRGVFALCLKCWDEAPLAERVDAYCEVLKRQGCFELTEWKGLALAVGVASA